MTTIEGPDMAAAAPSEPAVAQPARAHRRWPARETLHVLLMALVQAGLAAALGHHLLGAGPLDRSIGMPWWALTLGFTATEAFVVHVQFKREAQTISTSELPLVLGLFFADPLQLVVGRLIGSAVICLFHRRSSLLKTSWNLTFVGLHTVIAVLLFRLLAVGAGSGSPLQWTGAYAGALVANSVGVVALALVVAVYDGHLPLRQLARDAVTGDPGAPIVVTIALVAVTCLQTSSRSVVLLLLTGAGLLLAYRAYAALSDRHLNLERLYRFTQAVSSSPEVDGVLGNVLSEAKELLRSESAEIAFVASTTDDVAHVRLGASGRLTRSEEKQGAEGGWLLAQVVTEGIPLLVPRGTRDADQRRWLAAQSAREALAVPLRGGAGIIGVLVVTDRLGEVRTYDGDDVLLLETVANHASVALQNGELIDRLRHDAMHDPLTGLPNRVDLLRHLAAELDSVADGRLSGVAVMILDLDGFKEINETLGHQQGDLLLVEVAERLRSAVGALGTVARLGGDEFAFVVSGTDDDERALQIGRRLLSCLEQPVALAGIEVDVGGSLGVAIAPAHAQDASTLLKRADMAMYDAKASTRGVRIYEADLDTKSPRRLALVSELRSALAGDQIEVHVQPKARLTTGAVDCVEALVRWKHPESGWLPPDEFVPIAERSGLIGPLTTRVLDDSIAAVAEWRRQGHDICIAVNLSTRSLHDPDLVDEVLRLLRRHSVPASRLTLEVTEGSVMADPTRAIALLEELRDHGVRLSVDDFGTGYSSLSYLKRLPVHEVKIDRSFVTGLRDNGEDVAIVRAIVDLGRHLGLEVVAEGVEDQETWDLLTEMACDLVQGWHLGRPMPTEDFVPWLRARGAPVSSPVSPAGS